MDRKLKLAVFLMASLVLLAFTPYQPFFGGKNDTIVTDWARRVVANGGAMPSQTSIVAMENLRVSLISLGLTNKIWSLCIFVPDSIIAATTPLIKNKGSDPWTNNFFGSTNLTINGLKGDGATKSLDTGVQGKNGQAANVITGSRGLTVIITESSTNAAQSVIGIRDADSAILELLQPSFSGRTEWYPATVGTTSALTNDFIRVGYISGNVWTNGGTTNTDLFVASPLESHKLITRVVTSGATGILPATATDNTISAFAYKWAGTNTGWTTHRMSMACVNDGFSQTESSNFWVAVRTCREALGGGTGDPVQEWSRYVTNFGGAAVSVTTSNALRTFWQGLDTDDLLYRTVVANAFVPDNLTAARVPIIWQGGAFPIWTNNLFATSNLSVGGLTGDGTSKYLGTGLVPSTSINRGLSSTSAGIVAVVATNSGLAARYELNGQAGGSAATSHFGLALNNTNVFYFCWRAGTINADFIRAFPLTFTNAYYSGQRTAANAIALYAAKGSTVHVLVTNATGNQAGSIISGPLTPYVANADGVPSAGTYSDHTLSFLAVTSGLTQTQSSNLWRRVETLRTALGGGTP